MYLAYRWRDRNLGRGELIIAIILISTLIGFFVDKTIELFGIAEERLVATSVANMNTTLQLYAALHRAGYVKEVTESINPLSLVQSASLNKDILSNGPYISVVGQFEQSRPVRNSLGELFDPDISSLEKGNWYFDKKNNVLSYLPKYIASDSKTINYRVILNYNDTNLNNSYDSGIDILESMYMKKVNQKG